MMTGFQYYQNLLRKKLFLIAFALCIFSFQSGAADYYWVGGRGNWDDLSHWATTSGGTVLHNQIPRAVDDVYFDANSFSAPGQTVTLDPLTILCRNMTWTGVTNTPTLTGPSSNLLKIYGSLTFVSGMTMSFGGEVNFEATSAGQTITMGGRSFNNTVNLNGAGGGWTLQDAFSCSRSLILTNGTLTTNNQTVNISTFGSSGNSPRTLNMGSSVFNLSNINNCWSVSMPFENLTINCGTSVINATGSSAAFGGGDQTYYDVNFTSTLPGATCYMGGSNTFHNVNFMAGANISGNNTFNNVLISHDGFITGINTYNDLTLSAGYTYRLGPYGIQTINGSLNVVGNCGAFVDISSILPGTQATISHPAGVVNISYAVLKDIKTTGGGSFTAGSSIDLGNNTGWTFTSPGSLNLYWVGNGGNWDDGNHWSLSSGGPPSGCSPSPLDNVFFDANSFTSTGQAVAINIPTAYCRNMTWTGVTNTPALTGPSSNLLKIYGSLTFVSGMTMSFGGEVNFEATSAGQTITMGGRSFNNTVNLNGAGGGWTLQDAFSCSRSLILTNGTLTTNNQTVNISTFGSSGNSPRTLNMGSSVFNLSNINNCWSVSMPFENLTINCGTSVINASGSSAAFGGGDQTYYDVNFTSTLPGATCYMGGSNTFHNVNFMAGANISGNNTFNNVLISHDGFITGINTYNDLTLSAGYTYRLGPYGIQTINGSLNVVGNCGAFVDISSILPGTQATISHPAGVVNISYTVLKDIKTTGGGSFTAGSSIDLGNNTGWTFTSPGSLNLYWVGNGGNWDDGNHWSLSSGGPPSGCSPSPLDNVFFDANSFTSTGQAVAINIPTAYCRNMTWTGVTNTPALTGPSSNLLKIYGSLTFVSGMTMSFGGEVNFEATSAGQTITMGGRSFNNTVNLNGAGGGWTLQDAFSCSRSLILTNGTLTTNNQTVNISTFGSSGNSPRTLNMGSSVFNLSNINNCWSVSMPFENLTINCGTSVINASGSSAAFGGGDQTYYDVNFTSTLPGATCYMGGSNTFHNVNFMAGANISGNNTFNNVLISHDGLITGINTYNDLTLSAGYTYRLGPYGTQTINGRWQVQGSCVSYIVLESILLGVAATITKPSGSVLGFNIHIKDINCTGGADFFAYNSVDLGGNSGWQFQTLMTLMPPDIVTGPAAVCSGAQGVVYHTPPVSGSIYYQWTVPPGATITSGQGDTLIVVDFGTATTGNISVLSFNGCNYSTTGSGLTVVLAAQLTPAVSLAANPAGPVCPGSSISFTATATNTGTSTLNYNFKVNGTSVQNGTSGIYTTTALLNGDAVTCEMSVSAGTCYPASTALSNTVLVSLGSAGLVPTVSVAANPSGPVCSGTPVSFTATVSNTGGGTVSYNFKVDGVSVQNSASDTYTSGALTNGNSITCEISITGGTCLSSTVAASTGITMAVTAGLTPAVTITANPAGPVCSGTPVSYTAAASNTGGGTVSYNFKVDGVSVQNSASGMYTSSTLVNGSNVTCEISITGGTCIASASATSNTVTVSTGSGLMPSVTLTVNPATAACAGTDVSYTAAASNTGGGIVSYDFKVDGVSVQNSTSGVYTTNALVNGDNVTCEISIAGGSCLSAATASSNSIAADILQPLTASVNITASSTSICPGSPVSFLAAVTNGGNAPVYQWKINGVNVGANSSSFISSALQDGDMVTCELTSNLPCVINAVSNTITMTVSGSPAPLLQVTASGNPVCANTPVTFTALPTNAGAAASFKWQINGNDIAADGVTYSSNELADGDKVNCIMITENGCGIPDTVSSDTISMTVYPVPVISFNIPDTAIFSGDVMQLNATVTGTITSYTWSPSVGLNDPAIHNPVANPTATTVYKLTAISAGNCSAGKTLTITVLNGLYIPNAFAPGGTANTVFRIPPSTAFGKLYSFSIFNRYGELVFESSDINKGWDGTFKGVKASAGAYTYMIRGIVHKREVVLKGTVLLLR